MLLRAAAAIGMALLCSVGVARGQSSTAVETMGNGAMVDPVALAAVRRGGRVAVTVLLSDGPGADRRPAARDRIAAHRDSVLQRIGVPNSEIIYRFESIAGFQMVLDAEGLDQVATASFVARVEFPRRLRVSLTEGAPLISADDVWAGSPPLSRGYDGAGQVVAVIDSGIDYTHPALGGCFGAACKVADGRDFVNGDDDPMDDLGHGTGIAGIVASESSSAPGVAPGARLVALKVIRADGTGLTQHMEQALDWVATNGPGLGVTLVNLSFTGEDVFAGDCSAEFGYAATAAIIDEIVGLGIAVFVSSGNGGCADRISAPACVPSTIAVGAVYDAPVSDNLPLRWLTTPGCEQPFQCADGPCCADGLGPDDVTVAVTARDVICFTNSGPSLDLLAPSYSAETLGLGGGVAAGFSGTSAATPYAVGAAALLLEAAPTLTPVEARDILVTHAAYHSTDPKNGISFPVVDAFSAVASVAGTCACEEDADCDDGDDATVDRCVGCVCDHMDDAASGDGGEAGGGGGNNDGACGCVAVGGDSGGQFLRWLTRLWSIV